MEKSLLRDGDVTPKFSGGRTFVCGLAAGLFLSAGVVYVTKSATTAGSQVGGGGRSGESLMVDSPGTGESEIYEMGGGRSGQFVAASGGDTTEKEIYNIKQDFDFGDGRSGQFQSLTVDGPATTGESELLAASLRQELILQDQQLLKEEENAPLHTMVDGKSQAKTDGSQTCRTLPHMPPNRSNVTTDNSPQMSCATLAFLLSHCPWITGPNELCCVAANTRCSSTGFLTYTTCLCCYLDHDPDDVAYKILRQFLRSEAVRHESAASFQGLGRVNNTEDIAPPARSSSSKRKRTFSLSSWSTASPPTPTPTPPRPTFWVGLLRWTFPRKTRYNLWTKNQNLAISVLYTTHTAPRRSPVRTLTRRALMVWPWLNCFIGASPLPVLVNIAASILSKGIYLGQQTFQTMVCSRLAAVCRPNPGPVMPGRTLTSRSTSSPRSEPVRRAESPISPKI